MIHLKTLARNILISDFIGNCIRFVSPTIRFNQLKFSVSSKQIKGKIVSLIFFQKYEREEVVMIRKFMRNDLPIIELGTSLGVVATTAAKISSNSIQCVEANKNLIPVIHENFGKNNIPGSRVSIINAAVCAEEDCGGILYFALNGSNELGRLCAKGTPGSVEVQTTSLINLSENIDSDEFVLISDIEGAEAAFLYDDHNSLAHCRQLFIELHDVEWKGSTYTVSDHIRQIESLGFSLVEQQGSNFYFTQDAA